jgi:hypothetical protein
MPRIPRDGLIQRHTLGRSSSRTIPLRRLRLAALDKLLADAFLAAVHGDIRLLHPRDRVTSITFS